MSRQLKAVLVIFRSCSELQIKALPFVDVRSHEIDWDTIFRQDFGSGHTAAVRWAYTIWCGGYAPGRDPFLNSLAMDDSVVCAVLAALRIWWQVRTPPSDMMEDRP